MQRSKICANWIRLFDRAGAQYIITLSVGLMHGHGGGGNLFACYPQAWAVVDDFGTLVAVQAFK